VRESSTGTGLVRVAQWCGVHAGESVVVDLPRERRHPYEFVAYVENPRTGENWVDVRGRGPSDHRLRSFRPDAICPLTVRSGHTAPGPPLLQVPRLGLKQEEEGRIGLDKGDVTVCKKGSRIGLALVLHYFV
jgi:hypothetical protein